MGVNHDFGTVAVAKEHGLTCKDDVKTENCACTETESVLPDWSRHREASDVNGVEVGAVEVGIPIWSLFLCDLTL